MAVECSVVNCDNTPGETKVFYKFPMAFDTCMQWVQNTGNQKLMQELALGGAQHFEQKFICSDHFLDKDFAIFGQPQSGLMCHAVPLIKNEKREPNIKMELPMPSDDMEDTTINSYIPDDAALITRIKAEPEPVDIDIAVPLPLKLLKPEDENSMSSTYDAVSVITDSTEGPRIIESTLPLAGTSVFSLDDENIRSDVPLIRMPKVERLDIEEILLPETVTEDDINMEMEDEEDQFDELTDEMQLYCEDFTGNRLLDLNYVEYLNSLEEGSKSLSKDEWKSMERKKKDALRQSIARQNETPEQRAIRLEKTRIRAQERRHAESEVQTTIRRYKSAVRAAIKRSVETEEEKKLRQEKNKIRAAERRKNMTPEERAQWRERNRIQTRDRRQNESDIKKLVRRYNNALRASLKRSRETPEQRMERRIKDALRAAERRKTETPEEREERLRKDRERITLRRMELLMTETPEQRELRLKKERDRMYRKRHGIKEESPKEEKEEQPPIPDPSNVVIDNSLLNLNPIFPTIISMLPPNIDLKTQSDVKNVNEC